MDFTTIFWFATVVFFVSSAMLLLTTSVNRTVLVTQIVAGSTMFASSKLGRAFLGLE